MGNCNLAPQPMIQVGPYEFSPNDIIGSGHHGVLFQGSPRKDKLFEIAIKKINHTFEQVNFQKVESILHKLMSVSHENLVRYIDYYYDQKDHKLYLIMEYCAHGNLHDLIQVNTRATLREELKVSVQYCHQIIAGLVSLHEKGIYHGNLRPHNILIHYDCLKISDFGLTLLEDLSVEGVKKRYSIYKAPELFRGSNEVTSACDIWSLGVILYQLMYKERPIEVNGGRIAMNLGEKEGRCKVFDDLIEKCLKVNPDERITIEELRSHPFMTFNPKALLDESTERKKSGSGSGSLPTISI